MYVRAAIFSVGVAISLAWPHRGEAQEGPVADFYRGKTINLLIGTGAGGEYDLHARLVGRFIGKYIPGNPKVVPQNMLGGGGIVMANYLYSVAARDGTAIGVLNNGYPAAQAMGDPAVKFDASKMFWIGTLAPTSETIAVWHTANVRTIKDAMEKEVVIGVTSPGSILYTFPKLLNELIGTRLKLVTGYRGGVDINVAMESGEVHGRENTWSSWKTTKPDWLKSGKISIIVQGGETAKDLAGVPNIEELAKSADDKAVLKFIFAGSRLGRPLATGPDIPSARVDALRDAFDATMKDPEFLAASAQATVEVAPVRGVELQAIVGEIVGAPKSVSDRAAALLK